MFSAVYKTITFLWPFIREMVLGETTFKEAAKKHRGRAFIIVVIITSLVLNFLVIPRLITISANYVELNKKYKSLQDIDLDNRSLLRDNREFKIKVSELSSENEALKEQLKTCSRTTPASSKGPHDSYHFFEGYLSEGQSALK